MPRAFSPTKTYSPGEKTSSEPCSRAVEEEVPLTVAPCSLPVCLRMEAIQEERVVKSHKPKTQSPVKDCDLFGRL